MARDLVIGLGNPIMGDDALGIAALERLRAEWDLPAGLELVDGGTWGMNLLPLIESAARVLLLDAIRFGDVPVGAEIVLRDREIPRQLALKVSQHQIDLREVLALAELRGRLPVELVAVGLQTATYELGDPMSPAVEANIGRVAALAAEQLRAWGHDLRPAAVKRPAPSWKGHALTDHRAPQTRWPGQGGAS